MKTKSLLLRASATLLKRLCDFERWRASSKRHIGHISRTIGYTYKARWHNSARRLLAVRFTAKALESMPALALPRDLERRTITASFRHFRVASKNEIASSRLELHLSLIILRARASFSLGLDVSVDKGERETHHAMQSMSASRRAGAISVSLHAFSCPPLQELVLYAPASTLFQKKKEKAPKSAQTIKRNRPPRKKN